MTRSDSIRTTEQDYVTVTAVVTRAMRFGGIVGKLFKFQADGLQQLEMHERETGDKSALIGDEMGLGKTVEAIVLDSFRRRKHQCDYTAQTLIVTQTSVMGGWEKHYKDWAPWLKVMVIDRKNRDKFKKALTARDAKGNPEWHIFICHWQVLRFIAEDLRQVDWFHVIGDEIQNIKNRKAQQTQAFKKLKTYYKTGLSGTWADNLPADAWSVLNWLWPDYYSSYWRFFNGAVLLKQEEVYVKGVLKTITKQCGFADPQAIWDSMGKGYLRRLKVDVWEDLPEKTYQDLPVNLHPQQRRTYDMMRNDMLTWVGQNEDQPLAAQSVIAKLVRLQQFAVAYGEMQKMVRTRKYSEYQLAYMRSKGEDTGDGTYKEEYYQLVLTEPSSKLDAAIDLIEETNGSVVVFGQSKQAINLLAKRLQASGVPTSVLTGDTTQKNRDLAVSEFQSGTTRVFVSTIKAGGVGITLTAASTAIFLDWDWSPTKNQQAEDRIHRLGQKNACTYIRLVARDTVDRERNERIELKWEWLKQVLNPPKGR